MSIKSGHLLHTLRGADLLGRIADCGVNVPDIIRRSASEPREVGVMLVGSLSEGVGTDASDVDLLVLCERASAGNDRHAALQITASASRETLTYIDGLEVNVQTVFRRDMGQLVRSFIEIAPALYDPKLLKSIPLLDQTQLRFLHRLRTGIPMAGGDVIDRWRDELMTDLLPAYTVVANYVLYRELAEKAEAVRGRTNGTVALVGRRAAEAAMFALLATLGFTNPSRRWIFEWYDAAHVEVDEPPLPFTIARGAVIEALDLAAGALFPGRSMTSGEVDRYLQTVHSLDALMSDLVSGDPLLSRATAHLRTAINYVQR